MLRKSENFWKFSNAKCEITQNANFSLNSDEISRNETSQTLLFDVQRVPVVHRQNLESSPVSTTMSGRQLSPLTKRVPSVEVLSTVTVSTEQQKRAFDGTSAHHSPMHQNDHSSRGGNTKSAQQQ